MQNAPETRHRPLLFEAEQRLKPAVRKFVGFGLGGKAEEPRIENPGLFYLDVRLPCASTPFAWSRTEVADPPSRFRVE